jgi:hypothetical protein
LHREVQTVSGNLDVILWCTITLDKDGVLMDALETIMETYY